MTATEHLAESWHGTVRGYDRNKCRCADCKQAWSAYSRECRAARISRPMPASVPHGRPSTYQNWRCRCEACRDAHLMQRRRATGSSARKVPMSPEEFWALVSKPGPDACWPYTGRLAPTGYSSVYIAGSGNGQNTYGHRYSYEQAHGPIPDGLHIDHLCNNRACVNPAHLEAVTQAENNRRATSRDARYLRGEICMRGHDLAVHGHAEGGRQRCRECRRILRASRTKEPTS